MWVWIFAGLLLSGIYIYNRNVALRYSLNALEIQLQKLQVANADFKNDLYKTLDSKNLQGLAAKLSLVRETKPRYLESNSVVASQ